MLNANGDHLLRVTAHTTRLDYASRSHLLISTSTPWLAHWSASFCTACKGREAGSSEASEMATAVSGEGLVSSGRRAVYLPSKAVMG